MPLACADASTGRPTDDEEVCGAVGPVDPVEEIATSLAHSLGGGSGRVSGGVRASSAASAAAQSIRGARGAQEGS